MDLQVVHDRRRAKIEARPDQVRAGRDPEALHGDRAVEPLAVVAELRLHLRRHRRRPQIDVECQLNRADEQPEQQHRRQALQRRAAAVPDHQPFARPGMGDFRPQHAEKAGDRQELGHDVGDAQQHIPGDMRDGPETGGGRILSQHLGQPRRQIDGDADDRERAGDQERMQQIGVQPIARVPAERRQQHAPYRPRG
jgi:hypothetical protein